MTVATQGPELLIKEAIGKVSNLPTLPEVTTKIVELVNDPRSTAAQLHHLVSNDPALASRILKTVNSAFYGLPGQIGSMERAIVLLGLNAVKNIAVAASLGQLFRGVALCEGFTARDLWKHCIAVGVAARELARQTRPGLEGEAFLAGLIHDIGILVWLQSKPEQFAQVCQHAKRTGGDFCQIEMQMLGADHQMLGMALAEAWRFPRSCQMVAGYHHQPTTLAQEIRLLPSLVYVADIIACRGGFGFNLTAANQPFGEAEAEQLGVNSAIAQTVEQLLPELIKSADTFMD